MRAQLCGGAGTDRRRQRDTGDHRRDDADVEEGRQESGQRLDADVAQRRVALHRDDAAGGQRQEGGHADGAADDQQSAGAERHLGDEPDRLLAVARERGRNVADRLRVEQRLFAEAVDGPRHPGEEAPHPNRYVIAHRCHRASTRTPIAVMMTLITNRQMNA